AATTSLAAQASLLAATMCYAAYAVITRRAPAIPPRALAASTLISAAILSTPMLLLADLERDAWTIAGMLNVVGLGLLPTGLGGVLLITLIKRVGAGFMALANYVTPVWAVSAGAVLFNERLDASAFVALVVILLGVAISQSKVRKKTVAAIAAD
ncbi:MAG: EamA family transporter, partial [Pseudomonadota bacterium]